MDYVERKEYSNIQLYLWKIELYWDNSEERYERRNWMIIRRNAVGVL